MSFIGMWPCVCVGCVLSNISWNWFLAPYLSAVVRAPHTHTHFALATALLQICTKELLAHTEPEEKSCHMHLLVFNYKASFFSLIFIYSNAKACIRNIIFSTASVQIWLQGINVYAGLIADSWKKCMVVENISL